MRPTLYDHAGGASAMLRLATATTRRCLGDPELNHAFSHGMDPQHDERLAAYLGEVLGGPPGFTTAHGGTQTAVVALHTYQIPEDWNARFMACFVHAMDDARLPDDVEFRTAMRAYMEWAVTDTNRYPLSVNDVPDDLAMPRWGWGGLEPASR